MAKARRNAMDPAPWVAMRTEADGTQVYKGFLYKPNAEKWASKGKRRLRRRNVFAGPFSIGGDDYLGAGGEIEMPGGEFEGPGYARNNGLGMQGFARPNPPRTKRQRKKQGGRFTVYHADHGIQPAQMRFIQERLDATAPQGFFLKQINIPKRLGPVPNALYGPAAGDKAVRESKKVHYMDRSGRGWKDRMVDLPVRPWHYVQAIGMRDGNKFTLFTVYGGPLAERHPDDPTNPDPEGSRKFWSKHALSSQQWARGNSPVPWRGAKGQFSSAQRRFEGIQPYGRRNPLAHNNPSTERLITLSNFLARGARANAGELMGSTPRIPEEVMHLRTLRKRGAKGRLSAMEIELRDQSRTSDSGLLDYIRWLDTGKPKKLGWTKKQIKDYRALAMKEARRRVGIKTSRIIRHKGSKIGFGLKRQSEYGEKWPERRRRRIMAEASERYHEAEREEWISRLRGWQLAAHDLGIPFVGRKKEAVLLDIADEIGVDVGDIKVTGAKRTRRPRKKAVANARRVMSAGQWSQVDSPSAQRKLERLEGALEELEDQPEPERRRRLVRIAGRGKKVVGAPRRALERAHREREAEEFMEEELRKLRRNPG